VRINTLLLLYRRRRLFRRVSYVTPETFPDDLLLLHGHRPQATSERARAQKGNARATRQGVTTKRAVTVSNGQRVDTHTHVFRGEEG